MKYIKRILMLPFAWVMWTIMFSIKWVRYGGELYIRLSEDSVKPSELMALLKDLNRNICTLIEETK